jgi:hypothetical protein
MQGSLQIQETILTDVVRFVGGICREEGEEFFETNMKRQFIRFEAPNTFSRQLSLNPTLSEHPPVGSRQSDCATKIFNGQVTLQGTLTLIHTEGHLSADGRFQNCGNIVTHSLWSALASLHVLAAVNVIRL